MIKTVNIRVLKESHKILRKLAKKNGRTIQSMFSFILSDEYALYKKKIFYVADGNAIKNGLIGEIADVEIYKKGKPLLSSPTK